MFEYIGHSEQLSIDKETKPGRRGVSALIAGASGDLADELEDILVTSVRRLIPDVPTGAVLSGGGGFLQRVRAHPQMLWRTPDDLFYKFRRGRR